MKLVVMINWSQKFISYDFWSIIGDNWTSIRDSLTLYWSKAVFIVLFDRSFDRRLVKRNRTVEKGSKRSVKTVFGQGRLKLSFKNVQLCSIINKKSWEMNQWLLLIIFKTIFLWIYFSTALLIDWCAHIWVRAIRANFYTMK